MFHKILLKTIQNGFLVAKIFVRSKTDLQKQKKFSYRRIRARFLSSAIERFEGTFLNQGRVQEVEKCSVESNFSL